MLISAGFMKPSIKLINILLDARDRLIFLLVFILLVVTQDSEELLRATGSIVQGYLEQIRLSINIHCHTRILPILTALPAAPAAVLAVSISCTFAPFIIVKPIRTYPPHREELPAVLVAYNRTPIATGRRADEARIWCSMSVSRCVPECCLTQINQHHDIRI